MKAIAMVCVVFFIRSCSAQDVATEDRLRKIIFENYNKDIVPKITRNQPVDAEVGLAVIHINEIDFKTQTLDIDSWVRLSWKDFRLSWEPNEYSGIDHIKVGIDRLWKPDVTLYNGNHNIETEWSRNSKIQNALLYNDGKIRWIPAMSFEAYCDYTMTYYPYDQHTCSLKFGSWVFHGADLNLKLTENKTALDISDLHIDTEWAVVSTSATRNVITYSCCTEEYPDITFSLKLKRYSPIYQATVLLPVISGVILALGSFMMSPISKGRQALNALNLILFLITLYHLQNQLPSVGRKSPAILMICGTMIFILSLAVVCGFIATTIFYRMRNRPLPRVARWLSRSWLTKVLMVSKKEKQADAMKDYYEIDNRTEQENDGEAIAIEPENKIPIANEWMVFILLVDRIAFVAFILLIIVLTISFAS